MRYLLNSPRRLHLKAQVHVPPFSRRDLQLLLLQATSNVMHIFTCMDRWSQLKSRERERQTERERDQPRNSADLGGQSGA